MRYYIIAGEASGDLHGANLIKAIRDKDPHADVRCWGGDKMQQQGGKLVKHIRDLAFMGFLEVLKHLPIILGNISFCKRDILNYQPDVVVLIDYPGFNFRILKFLKENNFKICYYISPQLWAWKKGRVKQVKKYVDRMLVIFPFEKDFYQQYGVAVEFVGHPLLDELENKPISDKVKHTGVIALVPGSRKQEITYLLPEYLKVVKHFPDKKFVVTGMSTIGADFYLKIIGDCKVELQMDNTYGVLQYADAAIVTSGTATLETALHCVPEVICYKGSWVSYFIAHLVIDKSIGFICIVNLICGKKVVEELIQHQVNEQRLVAELKLLFTTKVQQQLSEDYTSLRTKLGGTGASERAANVVVALARQ